MTVIDAATLVEVLLTLTDDAADIRRRMLADPDLHAPHLVDAEVAQVVRRFAYRGQVDDKRSAGAIRDLRDIPVTRHAYTHLLPRIWALRHNFSAYDAAYVALAEALDARLLTRDGRLAAAVSDFTQLRLA